MKLTFRWVLIGISIAAGLPAYSQGVLVGANVSVDTFYDDQFETDISDSQLGGLRYQPSITFDHQGQVYQSQLSLGAVYNEFFDPDFEDNENFNISWDNNRNFQRASIQLGIAYSQRLLDDFVQLDDVTEITRADVVTNLSASPGVFWRLSERTRVTAQYQFSQTDIESDLDFDEDFDQQRVTLGWFRSLSPRSELAVFATYSQFNPGDSQNDAGSETVGLSVGGDYQLGNTWMLSGSLGVQQITFDTESLGFFQQTVLDDGQIVAFADIQLGREGRRGSIAITADAGTTQQVDGTIDNQQGLSVNWQRNLSQRLSSSLTGRYFQADRSDRRDYSFTAGLNWRSSPRWSYSLNYRFRDQLISTNDNDASSNRITLGIDYSFQDLILGR